ncbi:MAG: OadG family protein [Treponema sp.]|nr:OadG family protein [Treponema sp.]
MTIAEMLEQSGLLTMLGMGIVFGFLVIMIICITLAGKIIHALGGDKDSGETVKTAVPGTVNNAAITAAITAALTEYRRTNT